MSTRSTLIAAAFVGVFIAVTCGVSFAVDCDSEAKAYQDGSPTVTYVHCHPTFCRCEETDWVYHCEPSTEWHCIDHPTAAIIKTMTGTLECKELFGGLLECQSCDQTIHGAGKANLACDD